jgi:serine phosphatase RsbU (regulator of sigma subunit)
MASREDSSSFSKRLTELATKFEEKAGGGERRGTGQRRYRDTVLQDLKELFTRDVTREGLRNLIKRDARETLRFYTRTVDFESLRGLPWYKRHPAAAWKVFLALAYRLSPPRRIALALGIIAFIIGWIQFLMFQVPGTRGESKSSGGLWLMLSFAVFILLLLMELRDKLDLKGDLEIAREIQFGFVPSETFQSDATLIHSYMRPANTVGGDYYDIIKFEDHQVGVVVGDVSGKGMPAALLMALLLGSLRTLTTAGLRRSELIAKLNQYLCTSIPSNRIVTLFYGELDTATGDLCYVNAGHNAPFLMRHDNSLERLATTSLVLGVDSNASFEAKETRILPGDGLLLFTDGITEAFNAKEEEYGDARLASFLHRHAQLQPAELIKGVVDDVLGFCRPCLPGDDITMMSITRQATT